MSFRWPSKDPDETLDYSVDWSRFLDTAKINSVIWFVKSNTYNVKTQLNDVRQPILTGKYRNIFLGEKKNQTLKKIKAGIYKVINLNEVDAYPPMKVS